MIIRRIYSSLSRAHKKLIFVLLDLVFLPAILWASFALRFSDAWPYDRMSPFWWMFLLIPFCGTFIFARLGLYRAVVRFMGNQAVTAILKGVLFLSLLLYVFAHLSGVIGFPRSIPLNFALIAALYMSGSRYLVKSLYLKYINKNQGKESVIIYGAGEAGAMLSFAMANSKEFKVIAFVDDNASLQGHIVNGISVYAQSNMHDLVRRHKVSRVVLAIPTATRLQRNQVIEKLKPLNLHVQTLPSLAELATSKSSFEQFLEVGLDDLLGRDVVAPDEALLSKAISGKVVMVTGAGGTIGSELCRQIVMWKPNRLILYDNSEYALYSIENELSGCFRETQERPPCEMSAILGSVLDISRLDAILGKYGVQTIFHAAAYKHVPIVEHNISEGVRNNIFGTRSIAQLALRHAVERFVFISTDKAVRPTNVMGATKRVAEQVVQCLADKSSSTIFSMVRFGNVLGSSGSVVPQFRRQIEQGGPVTVTHRDITRFFMSIPEAAQLVIQAGTMAQGGEVFVLDMGKPVQIYELARNMIKLSGLTIRDSSNTDGDIAIDIIGLRPGEKLFEELLIGGNVMRTEHARIMQANETHMACSELADYLDKLERTTSANETKAALQTLKVIVSDYVPSKKLVDHLSA